jgi:acyl carrier protein
MDSANEVIGTLRSVLNLGDRAAKFDMSTPLLGAVPELDSMAVVSLLTSLEERFGITIEDDEVDGQIFATVGNLVAFVDAKRAG